jgi:hypothetical protein
MPMTYIITASAPAAISELLQLLNVDFAVKDLCALHYFLGVEVLSVKTFFSPNACIFWTY